MKIEELEDEQEFLKNMRDFFGQIDVVRDQLEKQLKAKDLERDDWLHEIELASLNAIERMRVYAKLEKVLKDRRKLKDKLKLINTLKNFTSKFITKGICAEINLALENVEKLKQELENRTYKPRVVKGLKCEGIKEE